MSYLLLDCDYSFTTFSTRISSSSSGICTKYTPVGILSRLNFVSRSYTPEQVTNSPFELSNFKENAEKRVKLSLLIGKIISDNNIQPEEKRVREAIEAIAASYEDPEDVMNYYMTNQDKLSEIQMMVVEDAVVDWIYDHVKVTESTSSFSEVMNAAK